MRCQTQLTLVYLAISLVVLTCALFIAAGIVGIALSSVWFTVVTGIAAAWIEACLWLAVAALGAVAALFAACLAYSQCVGDICRADNNRVAGVLLAIGVFAALAAYTAGAPLRISRWILGAAVPPLFALIVLFGAITVALILFAVFWTQYHRCVDATSSGSSVMMLSAGSGRGLPPRPPTPPPTSPPSGPRVDGPNLLALLNYGWWMATWPSGRIIDPLGPDTCPDCLYSIVVGGTVRDIALGEGGLIEEIQISGGEAITFDAAGRIRAGPVVKVGAAQKPTSGAPPGFVQAVVTEGGRLRAAIGSDAMLDFEPHLRR